MERDGKNYRPGKVILGESAFQVAERMKAWLQEAVKRHKPGDQILIISHSNAMKALFEEILNDDDRTSSRSSGNTGVTVFEIDESGKITGLVSNDLSHLQ